MEAKPSEYSILEQSNYYLSIEKSIRNISLLTIQFYGDMHATNSYNNFYVKKTSIYSIKLPTIKLRKLKRYVPPQGKTVCSHKTKE